MRIRRECDGAIPDGARGLTARSPGQDRAEEGDAVDVDGRRPDVVTDLVHALVVAGANPVVVLGGVRCLRELGIEAQFIERLGDHDVEILVALVVDSGAHGRVDRREDVVALHRYGRGYDADRPPGVLERFAVVVGDVAALVEDGETHQVEVHVDVAHLLHLENPPRGDPAPRAQWVEPEINTILLRHLHTFPSTWPTRIGRSHPTGR